MPATTEERKAHIDKKISQMTGPQRRDATLAAGIACLLDTKPECPRGVRDDFTIALINWYRTRLTTHIIEVLVGEGEEIDPMDVIKRIATIVLEAASRDRRESDRLALMFKALQEYRK